MMRLVLTLLLLAGLAAPAVADTPLFTVIMTRHGVRSYTRTPAEYTWPDWNPVAPGFLSKHGYTLVTYLGSFYRSYFASIGLPMDCGAKNVYVYADRDQRTLETGRALIEGVCGAPDALPLYHDAHIATDRNDTFFDGADWLTVKPTHVADPPALVARHAADFATLQSVMNGRCGGTCAPATTIDVASGYAENLFLEQAQCAPAAIEPDRLASIMALHVLEYDVNARVEPNAEIRGGNVLAHIVGLLQEKASVPHPDVDVPDVARDSVAIISGHDTQVGALGGILDAHWSLGAGDADDDMPPGGALLFELYRTNAAEYRVRIEFVHETLAQLRSASVLPDGVVRTPVHFNGCAGSDCSISLMQLGTLVHRIAAQGYVRRAWTPASDAPVELAPLGDPSWTHCM
jgi:4-phytase / acid phosphatase